MIERKEILESRLVMITIVLGILSIVFILPKYLFTLVIAIPLTLFGLVGHIYKEIEYQKQQEVK